MAQAMTQSASIPQASVWRDVDVTGALHHLDEVRQRPDFADLRLTPLTLVSQALITVMGDHPNFTALWDASSAELVTRADVRVGIAVATERGLLVPHFAAGAGSTLPELARVLTELTTAAREGRTTPEQLAPGSVTITNVGVFGVDGGTPLLYPGESAIVAMGRVTQRPWVVNGEIAVRSVLRLSITFDHRHIDGAVASTVLAAMSDHVEGLGT
jgi:pyruvate dehydrogenase E2 component (dihydrolipoamide acetyltransferase)